MATYPNNLYEPRNFENLPGLNRLTADKKNLYAEDLNETNAEIVAIETILGKNPNGAYASVKAWLEALASGGGGGVWGGITGTLSDQTDLFDALNARGKMPALKVFTSSGTYYPSSGLKYIEVEVVGGGGGGGKGYGTSSTNSGGSGGGAGGYAKKIISVDDLGESETITIGSGGAGDSSGGVGGTGGTTYFGSILSASGGVGGRWAGLPPGAGGSGTGGDINIGGGEGNLGTIYGKYGSGGLSFLCVLGAGGCGGSGNGAGLAGKSGVVIIKEFF